MKLSTNGIDAPADFPTDPYEKIHAIVVAKRFKDALYGHYAGASNAVAYRFKAAAIYSSDFATALKAQGSSPPPEQRFEQERLLFDFFSSGFSVLESAFFELYVLGAFAGGGDFSLQTPRDQQLVTPKRTRDAYAGSFAGTAIEGALSNLLTDPVYLNFRETRNVLTHRAAPGRTMYVSIGSDDAPPADWKLNNLPLDETIATSARANLARLLSELLVAGAEFAQVYIK